MFDYFFMRLFQTFEFVKENGLRVFIKQLVYVNRIAIPVEMNLAEFNPRFTESKGNSYEFIKLDRYALENGNYQFVNKVREMKALVYVKKGYYGFALQKDNKIIADIWYSAPTSNSNSQVHKDMTWLGIIPRKKYVYAFDMFVIPGIRGHNIATYFQSSFLVYLRNKGWFYVYGYYWADNIQALWVHRLLKWKELGKVKVSRFFMIKKSRPQKQNKQFKEH